MPITPQDALEKIKYVDVYEDTEMAHVLADDVLCDLLESLGHKDVADAFRKMHKWYA